MPSRTPPIGDILHGDDGVAVVIADDATTWDALRDLLLGKCGLDLPDSARDHPDVVALMADLELQRWHSCTKAYREDRCDDPDEPWWAEDGDGARSIRVAWYGMSDLYDRADEVKAALRGGATDGDA